MATLDLSSSSTSSSSAGGVLKPKLRFALKAALLAVPGVLLVVAYVVLDPFMVLYSYPAEDYYRAQDLVPNRDYISTEIWKRRMPDRRYDSYIFGNSRSLAFLAADWQKVVGSHAAYHYDASQETLFGIVGKLRFLERSGAPLRHALLVVDDSILRATGDSGGHLFIKHPQVSGRAAIYFHAEAFKAYLARLFAIVWYKTRGTVPPFSRDMFSPARFRLDPATNDLHFASYEEQLAADPVAYYKRLAGVMARTPPKNGESRPRSCNEEARVQLREIREIFRRNGTDYRVVVAPLYHQLRLHPADVEALVEIFGRERVFDFSGVNELTRDPHNYYEQSHFKPNVARTIMARVYGPASARGLEPGRRQ